MISKRWQILTMATPRATATAIVLVLILGVGLIAPRPLPAEPEERIELYAIDQAIRKAVREQDGRDIGSLAAAPASPLVTTDAREAVKRFVILCRAGYDDKAVDFLPVLQLHNARLERLDVSWARLEGSEQLEQLQRERYPLLSQLADDLAQRERFGLTRRFLETFPRGTTRAANDFLKVWSKTATPEELDAWLEKQTAAAPEWSYVRFCYAGANGREAALHELYRKRIAEASTAAEKDLLVMQLAEGGARYRESPGIDWLPTVYQPPSATMAYRLAKVLRTHSGSQVIALHYLEKARDMPFGETDRQFTLSKRQVMQSGDLSFYGPEDKEFHKWVRHDMMELCKALGRNDDARKLMEEIAAESPTGMPRHMMRQAGEMQAGSSTASPIENRMLEAEKQPENEKSVDYWLERSTYYLGRNETDKATEAVRKALALTSVPKVSRPDRHKGGPRNESDRDRAVLAMVSCLLKLGRIEEGYQMLRQELAAWPVESDSASRCAYELCENFHPNLRRFDADDEIFWAWIEARKDWKRATPLALICGMADSLPAGDPSKARAFWDRAERLVVDDPERSLAMGKALIARFEKEKARGRKLITLAYNKLPPDTAEKPTELRQNAVDTLYRIYMEEKDWKSAAKFLPELTRWMSTEETTSHLDNFYELAARAGEPQAAMRFYTQARSYDRWSKHLSMRDLTDHGMKPLMVAWYKALIVKEPDCVFARDQLRLTEAAEPGR